MKTEISLVRGGGAEHMRHNVKVDSPFLNNFNNCSCLNREWMSPSNIQKHFHGDCCNTSANKSAKWHCGRHTLICKKNTN